MFPALRCSRVLCPLRSAARIPLGRLRFPPVAHSIYTLGQGEDLPSAPAHSGAAAHSDVALLGLIVRVYVRPKP